MNIAKVSVVVISHACIRQINRSIYRELDKSVGRVRIIIPDSIIVSSGERLYHEAGLEGDPEIIPLQLNGRNPRTYFYPDLITWLRKYSPDIVFLENDPVSRLGVMVSNWSHKNKKKIICQSYENMSRDVRSTILRQGWLAVPKNFIIHVFNYGMARRIDALLVVSKDSEFIFDRYGYSRVVRIPLGYDNRVFFVDNETRMRYRDLIGISSEIVLIGYFGRMVHQKGVHVLIQALSQLTSNNWMLLLDHAFDKHDQYTSYIQSLIKDYKLTDKIVNFEADHFEIANFMRATDILVAPSITTSEFKEQYGRSVQEAMACGCVCLVSDSGNLKDLVDDASLVFEENDVEALHVALTKWIQNKEMRKSCGQVLSEKANERLTVNKQAEHLVKLMNNLIEERIWPKHIHE